MTFKPSEEDIKRVMQETNMEYLQAMRHLQQRMLLQRQPNLYPLGKTAHYA